MFDRNYECDSRVLAGERASRRRFNEATMTLTFTLCHEVNGEDVETEIKLPAMFTVCCTCDGRGSHVNPSIDAGGITGSEMAEWDEEERETYFSGGYDVRCYDCDGKRVVPEIATDRLTSGQKADLARLEEQWEDEQADEDERRWERSMGA